MSNKSSKRYKLASEQFTLMWLEAFSIEKKNTKKENNLSVFFCDESADCNLVAMEQAFNRLLDYNDSLRLHIFPTIKGFRQSISDYSYEKLSVKELPSRSELELAKQDALEDVIGFFDNKLYKARLFKLPNGGGAIIMTFHHAVVDGYSISLIMEKFESYYTSFKNNEALSDNEKRYSIIPFLEDGYKYKKSKKFKSDYKFWWHAFNHQPGYSIPPGKRSLHGYNSKTSVSIDGELYAQLESLRKQIGCSDQSLIMGLSALTTYLTSGKRVFNIATLTHGRTKVAYKKTIGCMMNSVPVLFNIDPSQTVSSFLTATYDSLLASLAHSRFPLSYQLVMPVKYSILCGLNFVHNWLFVSKMDYSQYTDNSQYQCSWLPADFQSEQLYCAIANNGTDCMSLSLSYQNRKYQAKRVDNIQSTFMHVLNKIVENPNITIEELSTISM